VKIFTFSPQNLAHSKSELIPVFASMANTLNYPLVKHQTK